MVRAYVQPLANAHSVEWLVFLQPVLPGHSADAMLIGVLETQEAAEAIASALNQVFGCAHTHAPAI